MTTRSLPTSGSITRFSHRVPRLAAWTMLALQLGGCPGDDAAATGSSESNTGSSTTGSTGVGTAPPGADTSTSGSSTSADETAGPPPSGCDVFSNVGCAAGEDCVTTPTGDGQWSDPYCTADVGQGAPGGSCMVDSELQIDPCANGSVCWGPLDEAGPGLGFEGLCHQYCQSSDDCQNVPNTYCATVYDVNIVPLSLCLPMCDPLSQNCAGGIDFGCYWFADAERFLCAANTAPGTEQEYGYPCDLPHACDPGFLCVSNMGTFPAGDCMPGGTGCCTSLCDMGEQDTCSGDLVCEALFPGMPPIGAPAGVGICSLLQP